MCDPKRVDDAAAATPAAADKTTTLNAGEPTGRDATEPAVTASKPRDNDDESSGCVDGVDVTFGGRIDGIRANEFRRLEDAGVAYLDFGGAPPYSESLVRDCMATLTTALLGRAVQAHPGFSQPTPRLLSVTFNDFQLLKLKHDKPLSNSTPNCSLRHYSRATRTA